MTEHLTCWIATYGMSFIIANTHGPFGLCRKYRLILQRRFKRIKWIKDGLECPVCVSFWCGMIVAGFFGDEFFRAWLSSVGFVCVVSALSPD